MPRGRHLQRIPREERARRLGQEPLGPGEASEPVQVRVQEGVLKRFKELSAKERGKVVALGLIFHDRYEGRLEPEELESALEEMERFAELIERTPGPVWRFIEQEFSPYLSPPFPSFLLGGEVAFISVSSLSPATLRAWRHAIPGKASRTSLMA